MKTILADYRIFVPVTPDMLALRACPDCYDGRKQIPDPVKNPQGLPGMPALIVDCPTCKCMGLNPCQKPWWEALEGAELNQRTFCDVGPQIWFCEFPGRNSVNVSSRETISYIHRPFGDNCPWAECLEDLLNTYEDSTKAHSLSDTVSFALASTESAPVFKSFGIKTLVEVEV